MRPPQCTPELHTTSFLNMPSGFRNRVHRTRLSLTYQGGASGSHAALAMDVKTLVTPPSTEKVENSRIIAGATSRAPEELAGGFAFASWSKFLPFAAPKSGRSALRHARAYALSNGLPLLMGSLCWGWMELASANVWSLRGFLHLVACQVRTRPGFFVCKAF